MKRLLIFHPTIAPYRIDLFNYLAKEFDVRVCLSYRNLRSQTFDYSKIEEQFQFTPHYLDKRFVIRERVICKGYWKEIEEFNPDIILCSEFGIDCIASIIYRRLYKKEYKIVTLCDDSFDMVTNNNDFSVAHKILRKRIVPKLDSIILVEPDTVRWYRENYGKGIYFPIVADDDRLRHGYMKSMSVTEKYIRKYNLKGKKVYLFVGRLVAIKNVQNLVDAFDRAKIKDSVLVIVGDGPEREAIKNKALQTDSEIILTGRLEGSDLQGWFNIAGCFVLPSLKEPFGAVTNEALLAGAKVIVSEKAGSKCLVERNKNGMTFNPDCDDLSDILISMSKEIHPVDCSDCIRPSMMMKSFKEYFNEVINGLNSL